MNWPVLVTGLVVMVVAGVLYRFRVPYAKLNRQRLASLPLLGRRAAGGFTPRMGAGLAVLAFSLGAFAFGISFFSHG
jgi:hypothetical protein